MSDVAVGRPVVEVQVVEIERTIGERIPFVRVVVFVFREHVVRFELIVLREAFSHAERGAAVQRVPAAVRDEDVAQLRLEGIGADVGRRVARGWLRRRGGGAVDVVIQEPRQLRALGVIEVRVGRHARRELTLDPDVDAVDPRVAVVAIEHAHAGEERERARGNGGRREEIRPDRHVRECGERRRPEIALLLNPVRRDRSDLAQHVLAGIEDARAAADDCLAVLRDVPCKAGARLHFFPLIGKRAVRGKPRIVEEHRVRRCFRVYRLRHDLRVPAQTVIDGEPVARLPLVLHEQREFLVADIRCAGGVARDAVGTAALEIKEERTARRRRTGRTRGWGGHVRSVRATDGVRAKAAGRGRRRIAQKSCHAVEQVAAFEEATKNLRVLRVQPLAAGLDGVGAVDDGEIVLQLEPIPELVDIRSQEERVAEPERRHEPHARVGRNRRGSGGARAVLARVREVELVQPVRGDGAEQVDVQHADLRRSFDPVRGIAVARDVERLIRVLRVIEVVGRREVVRRGEVPIELRERRVVVDLVIDRLALFLAAGRSEKAEECEALAVGAAVDERLVRQERRTAHRARRADRFRQVRPPQVLSNAFERDEVERRVLDERAADRAAELLAVEVLERLAVGRVRGEPLHALIVEEAPFDLVRPRLGDHVDDAPGRAAEFGVGAGRHDLKLLHGFERDVDRGALSAHLLTEKAVVVVAAVEADVVEHAALAGEGDFVAVRALDHADARREREEVFELAPQNRRRFDGGLVQRAGGGRASRLHRRGLGRHGDGLGHAGELHHRTQSYRLADRGEDVLLHERRETGELERDGVAAGGQLQRDESAVAVRHERAGQVRIDVANFHVDARQDRAARVGDDAFDDGARDLRLRNGRRGQRQRHGHRGEQVPDPHRSTSLVR